MRIPLLLTLVVASAATLDAQAIQRPQPSGWAATQVTLAYPQGQAPADSKNAVIRIEYGQPHLRGRKLHTPDLVPYDKAWRTGANALTTLTTDVDLDIGGKMIPKGNYALFTLPSASGWKLIVQKNVNQSATEYTDANDVARIDLRAKALTESVESLTMWLVPSTDANGPARGELRLAWGTVGLSVPWAAK